MRCTIRNQKRQEKVILPEFMCMPQIYVCNKCYYVLIMGYLKLMKMHSKGA